MKYLDRLHCSDCWPSRQPPGRQQSAQIRTLLARRELRSRCWAAVAMAYLGA